MRGYERAKIVLCDSFSEMCVRISDSVNFISTSSGSSAGKYIPMPCPVIHWRTTITGEGDALELGHQLHQKVERRIYL